MAEDPEKDFEISCEDMLKLDDPNTLGTFHTHPNASSNLSMSDYISFLNYPRLIHYIYGIHGLRKFRVVEDFVIAED